MRWWVALALLMAGAARADVVEESGGTHHWPGRGRVGPETCTAADTRQGGNADGTWAYFVDAIPTCPMGCPGGPGAWCVHERGVWNCCAGVPPPVVTCTFMECPPPTVVIGHDPSCGDICSSDFCTPNPCVNGGQCILTGNGFLCLCPCNCSGTLCETCVTTSTTTTTTTTTSTSGAPTTTGTGATTTTTSTTTTTTTTSTTATTLPVFASTTFLVEPLFSTDEGSTDYTLIPNGPDAFHNQMACARVPEMIGITNATKMAALLTVSCAFPFRDVVFGIYEDSDSGAKLAGFSADCSGAAGRVSATGLPPFSLVRGTVYRYCTCNDSAGGGPVGAYGSTHWLSTGWGSENNVFVPSVGTAANVCAGVTMPATTGVLTPNGALGAPLILISRE